VSSDIIDNSASNSVDVGFAPRSFATSARLLLFAPFRTLSRFAHSEALILHHPTPNYWIVQIILVFFDLFELL
jgi:hypothetical protein